MHKTSKNTELEKYVCLVCDEAFFLCATSILVCPKCGNKDEHNFELAEAPDEEKEATKTSGQMSVT